MPRAQPADLFAEMTRILAGAPPTLPRIPPGRVMYLQQRSKSGLETVLAKILGNERNKSAAQRAENIGREAV